MKSRPESREKSFKNGGLKLIVWNTVSIKKTLQIEGLVRVIGLEPTCLTASDPKSDTSANFATPANAENRLNRARN